MSWDIYVQDLSLGVSHVSEIPDDFVPERLGTRASIIAPISEVEPDADFSDRALLTLLERVPMGRVHEPQRRERPADKKCERSAADHHADDPGDWPWLEALFEEEILIVQDLERRSDVAKDEYAGIEPVEDKSQPKDRTVDALSADVDRDDEGEGEGRPDLEL